MPELKESEIQERIAILHKFRQLLEQKRQKFRDYLSVLEKQEIAIANDDIDVMVSHAELEQSIVSEIFSIQKVIDPFEQLYKAVHPSASESEIPHLEADLEKLKTKVLAQNEINRNLLKNHMGDLRQKISGLKNPYTNKKSVYASDSSAASIIDIKQ